MFNFYIDNNGFGIIIRCIAWYIPSKAVLLKVHHPMDWVILRLVMV